MISADAIKTISLKKDLYYRNIEQVYTVQKNIISILSEIIQENKINFSEELKKEIDTVMFISEMLLNDNSKTPGEEENKPIEKKDNVVPIRRKPNFKFE
jgi:hypothetical protein